MRERLRTLLHDEALLCIALVLACASLVMAGDISQVPHIIDWRVIVLLFCLMASVAGMRSSGALALLARALVAGERSKRVVCLALVMMPFWSAMLVTNDVALLAFVPIAVLALETAGWDDCLARVIVLQAIAANLGGMVTPIGNPQNLFIFTIYELSAADFAYTLIPFGTLAFLLLVAACLPFGTEQSDITLEPDEDKLDVKRFILHAALFVLSVLAVMRVLPYPIVLVITAPVLLLLDRRVFAKVDYALLATFICFFVFSGNMAHMPTLQAFLGRLMNSHPMVTSLLASQVISNVPAAVLLSGFTQNWHSLLVGVDLGALGTPIASLASLIAFKLYMHTRKAYAATFMRTFILANLCALSCLIALYAVLFVS